ncbi:MAG TPA: hypothetical protein VJ746_13770 [Nitrospira sp.]|nr:hypothetical protein [Nitrospira sp.]
MIRTFDPRRSGSTFNVHKRRRRETIPNNSFLERHLTNWTYSTRTSRFSLRVGMPYTSSAQT